MTHIMQKKMRVLLVEPDPAPKKIKISAAWAA